LDALIVALSEPDRGRRAKAVNRAVSGRRSSDENGPPRNADRQGTQI